MTRKSVPRLTNFSAKINQHQKAGQKYNQAPVGFLSISTPYCSHLTCSPAPTISTDPSTRPGQTIRSYDTRGPVAQSPDISTSGVIVQFFFPSRFERVSHNTPPVLCYRVMCGPRCQHSTFRPLQCGFLAPATPIRLAYVMSQRPEGRPRMSPTLPRKIPQKDEFFHAKLDAVLRCNTWQGYPDQVVDVFRSFFCPF